VVDKRAPTRVFGELLGEKKEDGAKTYPDAQRELGFKKKRGLRTRVLEKSKGGDSLIQQVRGGATFTSEEKESSAGIE